MLNPKAYEFEVKQRIVLLNAYIRNIMYFLYETFGFDEKHDYSEDN